MPSAALEAVARAAGADALPGFFAGLALTVVLVLLLRAVLRRIGLPHERNRLSPGAFLLVHLGAGFGGLVIGAAVFAGIAEAIGSDGSDGTFGRIDQIFSDAVVGSTPAAAIAVFAVVTHLGDRATQTVVCIAVAALLIGRGRRTLAVAWVSAVAGNGILNTTLKNVFERARPLHQGRWVEAGYSFPSGHSSGSVVVYGMLAYLALRLLPPRWHLPAVLAAAGTVYTTGCSRVFLQVHFASDVAAGFVSGLAWLAVCIVSAELLRRREASPAVGP